MTLAGAIAQLGERDNGIVEVGGSIPPGSTSSLLVIDEFSILDMLIRRSKAAQERSEQWQLRIATAFVGYMLCVIGPIACYLNVAYCLGKPHTFAGICGLAYLLYGVGVLAICSSHKPAREAVMWAFQIPRCMKWMGKLYSYTKNLASRNTLSVPISNESRQ